ncbi:MAG TPA: L-seryl-tRNA(Sec) selenium transferase [Clostridiaceae bacterium]|nr:L-seryl-tRNA(Sec) selenium transferase [Clostridiaceae bacterium]
MTIIDSPRLLPKVDDLLRDPRLDAFRESMGHVPVRDALREILEAARQRLLQTEDQPGRHPDLIYLDQVLSAGRKDQPESALTSHLLILALLRKLEEESRPGIRKVINATGAILHTNLGRAPLARQALAAVKQLSEGYSSLEFDLETNQRGQRTSSIEALIRRLFDVESAIVVNNNAAAVMLALSALCRGREVIVSRGELVEIGGRFRVPEIMEESGAVLREVGTTNKTHILDYERAVNEETAALMKVHRSNFSQTGFVGEAGVKELADLAHNQGLPLIYDLGSGCFSEDLAALLAGEPTVAKAIGSGADVICFSGDKLLGGPQAGIIIGKSQYIDVMRSHPLMRAFRCDKMALAALEATLVLYQDPDLARASIPILRMALTDRDALRDRIRDLALRLQDLSVPAAAVPSKLIMGGGSAPEIEIPSWALEIDPQKTRLSAASLEARLRAFDPPILCRTSRDVLLFDLRTVTEEEERILLFALADVCSKEEDPL